MSNGLKVVLVLLVLVLLGGGSCAASLIGINNNLVSQEEGLKAQYKSNQSEYDAMFKKILEMSQVPEAYSSDLQKLFEGTMKGRYGAEGSKAIFQMIKEDNPKLDPKMYSNIQETIEASRNSFNSQQKMLLDKKRVYEISLHTFPNSLVASFLGFPKIDLDKFDIVSSDRTEKAFDTKKDDVIKLR